MTIKGRLTEDHTAYVEVELESGYTWEFIVDTGFSGALCLPEDLVTDWGLPFLTSIPVLLADQSTTVGDVHEATVNWVGRTLTVEVVAGVSGSDALIGMELLEGCRIELDQAKHEVRIERL